MQYIYITHKLCPVHTDITLDMIGGRVPPWWRRVAFAGTKQVYHASPKPVIYNVSGTASPVNSRPPSTGPSWRAWDDSPLPACKFICLQIGQVRRKGSAWHGKQALLYQLVGYDMAVRPSAPQEGGLLAGRVLELCGWVQ